MDLPFIAIVLFGAACIYGVGAICSRSSLLGHPQGEDSGLLKEFRIDNRPEGPSPYDNPSWQGFGGRRQEPSAFTGMSGRRGVDEIHGDDDRRSAFDDDDLFEEPTKGPDDMFTFGDGLLGCDLNDSMGSSCGLSSISSDDDFSTGGSSIGGGIGDDLGGGMIGDDSI